MKVVKFGSRERQYFKFCLQLSKEVMVSSFVRLHCFGALAALWAMCSCVGWRWWWVGSVLSCQHVNKEETWVMLIVIMTFREFPSRPELCPVRLIWKYLDYRNSLTDDRGLFITLKSPFRTAQPATTARWVREMLTLSGVSDGRYTAHTCRAAPTFSAHFWGISLSTIIKSASWKKDGRFKRFYLKEIKCLYDNRDNFGEETLNNL